MKKVTMKWKWGESGEKREVKWSIKIPHDEQRFLPVFSFELKFLVSVFLNLDRVQCDLFDVAKFLSVEYSFLLHINYPKHHLTPGVFWDWSGMVGTGLELCTGYWPWEHGADQNLRYLSGKVPSENYQLHLYQSWLSHFEDGNRMPGFSKCPITLVVRQMNWTSCHLERATSIRRVSARTYSK